MRQTHLLRWRETVLYAAWTFSRSGRVSRRMRFIYITSEGACWLWMNASVQRNILSAPHITLVSGSRLFHRLWRPWPWLWREAPAIANNKCPPATLALLLISSNCMLEARSLVVAISEASWILLLLLLLGSHSKWRGKKPCSTLHSLPFQLIIPTLLLQ